MILTYYTVKSNFSQKHKHADFGALPKILFKLVWQLYFCNSNLLLRKMDFRVIPKLLFHIDFVCYSTHISITVDNQAKQPQKQNFKNQLTMAPSIWSEDGDSSLLPTTQPSYQTL